MYCRVALLWILMSVVSAAHAANDAKQPVVLLPREAKLSPGMTNFMSSTLPAPYVGGWMDKSKYIDYELKVEPGRYRLVASIVPQGGGYLQAKVDDGQNIRRQVAKLRQAMYKPIEIKFGEIDIPAQGSHLRFTGDDIAMPGLCLFFQAELTWVGPLPISSKAKSPLQLAAEKEKALKEALAAKAGQELLENLKGTTWTFYPMSDSFMGQTVPMVFGVDGKLRLFGNPDMAYKAVDGRTLDILYGAPGAFSRLRFADDMGSFKSDLAEGIRQPRSGRLQKALGSPSSRPGAAPSGGVPLPGGKSQPAFSPGA
jgi:hypothetical protein